MKFMDMNWTLVLLGPCNGPKPGPELKMGWNIGPKPIFQCGSSNHLCIYGPFFIPNHNTVLSQLHHTLWKQLVFAAPILYSILPSNNWETKDAKQSLGREVLLDLTQGNSIRLSQKWSSQINCIKQWFSISSLYGQSSNGVTRSSIVAHTNYCLQPLTLKS